MVRVRRGLLALESRIYVLGVLSHDDEVEGVAKVARALVGLDRSDQGEEVELLAQRDVDASKPAADRRRYRTFESDLVFANGRQHRLGKRSAKFGDSRLARLLDVPVELDSGGLEDSDGGVADLWADAVTRDESYRMPTQSGPTGF